MSLAEKLALAWETMEAGREAETLVRTLGDLGFGTDVLVGVDDTGAREFLFRIGADDRVAAPPPVRGVRVFVRSVRSGSDAARFLVVRCDLINAHRVFARFAADVLEQTAGVRDVVPKLLEVLAAWREMFRREAADSESTARGLFGELDELRRIASIDVDALSAWRGPANEPQDFVRGAYALEVKSTRNAARFVEVHGLRQLWSAPFELLLLSVKHVTTDAGGESVADVVRDLIAMGIDGDRLHELVEPFGFLEPEPRTSCPRFRVRGTRYYTIDASSPVLTPDSLAVAELPSGVSKITYELELDATTLRASTVGELDRVSRGLVGR